MDTPSSSRFDNDGTARRHASLLGAGGSQRWSQGQNQGQTPQTPPLGRHAKSPWRGVQRWLEQNSFAPEWLPESLRHPRIGYLAAGILEVAAVAIILLILAIFPSFAFHGVLTVVMVVLIALGWGAGPGLFAALIGTFLLYYAVLPPRFAWTVANPADIVGLLLYVVVGVCVSVLASGSEQRRRQAEDLSRKLARAQTRSARDYQRLRTVLDAMPSAVLIVGPDGQIEEANQATKTLWGGDIALASGVAQYALYRAWWPTTGQPVAPEEWAAARALASGVAQVNDEMEIEALDGQHKLILNSAVPLRAAGGAIVGVVINAQDITEVRRLEREVAERARELGTLFDSIGDGIAILDAKGNLMQANHALGEMFGFAQQPDLATLPLEERAAAFTLRDEQGLPLPTGRWPTFRLLQGEALAGADMFVTTLEGREIAVNVSGAPLRNEAGHITGCVEVLRDVTARRELDQRTHDTVNALVAIGEALVQVGKAPMGVEPGESIAVMDVPTVARRMAELARGALGCRRVSIAAVDGATGTVRPLAVVGLSPAQEHAWWESFAPSQTLDERLNPATAATLRVGHPVLLDVTSVSGSSWNLLCQARTGLVVPMRFGDIVVGTLMLDYGELEHDYATTDEVALTTTIARLGALVLERDRLLRQWTEARANELALLATKAQMDTFLGVAVHELKAPLTHVQLSLHLTESRLRLVAEGSAATQGDAGERAIALFQEHLAFTQQAVDQLVRLVNDLVDASRVQGGKLVVRPEACDLAAIVQRAVSAQRLVAADRRIELQMPAAAGKEGGEGEREVRIPVVADPGRIEQVVTNYLTNALKYSPGDRPVEVGMQIERAGEGGEGGEERLVRVWVRDEGPGLPADEQEHIWERFHRAKGIEVQSGSGIGLGLGLYICRTIVEQHHGQVGVDSTPGAGSTFWFTMPLAGDTVPEPGSEAHQVQLFVGTGTTHMTGGTTWDDRQNGASASAVL